MSVALEPVRPKAWQIALVAALTVAGILPAAAQGRQPTSSRTVVVTVDRAEVMKLPTGVATLVLGNPLIADVSIQSGGMAVLTGKGYGTTNLLALDNAGAGSSANPTAACRPARRESPSATASPISRAR